VYCEEKKNVFSIVVCRTCSQMPPETITAVTKGAPKPPLKAFRSMLNGIGEPFYEHICTAIDYQPALPEAEVSETPQDDSQVQKLELLLDQRGQEVEQLTQENQRLREQLNRATVKTVSPKPAAKAAPEVAPELPQLAALNALLEKFDKQQAQVQEVLRENGVLSEQVRALTERLATEESLRAEAEAALQTIPKEATVKPAAPVIVERTTGGNTEGLGQEIVCSLASIMPLLNELRVGDANTRSMDNFLAMVELGIRQPAQAAQVRKTLKTCVLIARLVGASKAVTLFSQVIRRKFEESPEDCLQLVHSLKHIYRSVAKEEGAREVMKEILLKLEGDSAALTEMVKLIGFLSDALSPNQLSELTQALFRLLGRPAAETKDWLEALAAIPLQWQEQYREKALQSIRKVLAAAVLMNFDGACLQLLQILNKYTHADPEPLFAFISGASESLHTDPVPIKTLITKLFTFLVSPETSQDLSPKVLSALRIYFTSDSNRESIALLMCVLIALEKDTYAGLTWLYGEGDSAGPVEYVRKMLRLMLENGTEMGTSAEVMDSFFDAVNGVQGLAGADSLAFLKVTSHLCEAKPAKTQIILKSLTDVLSNAAAHPFIHAIAQLCDVNEAKGHQAETRKLLNTVRKFPTEALLPTANSLTSSILALRKADITMPIFTHKLKLVLRENTNNLNLLVAAIQPLLKSEKAAAALALRMLELLPEQTEERVHLLSFVGDLASALAAEIAVETAVQFCEDAILPCFVTENVHLLEMLQAQLQTSKLAYLMDMLRSSKRKFTTLDIYEQCFLPLLLPDTMRIFDCSRLESKTIPIEHPIKVDSSSSYAFVEDGGIVCCGGSDSTGAKNASASRASSVSPRQDCYQLSCLGKVAVLPNMHDARNYHGILYYAKTKGLYVFGGSSQPDVRRK